MTVLTTKYVFYNRLLNQEDHNIQSNSSFCRQCFKKINVLLITIVEQIFVLDSDRLSWGLTFESQCFFSFALRSKL